ncbi:MAG: helix-turn-helix transcriptional regulator [Bacteroidota bacterium]|nr:helix-turn-helix transcriptional regulator [Bacteroidota bacterium]
MGKELLKNNIKVFRAKYNLTQEELAVKVGVTRKTINTIENGVFIPSTLLALKIASVFNDTVENVFYIENCEN